MIEHIQKTYQAINRDSLDDGILRRLYTEDAEFIDPFHHIRGRPALETYFAHLYRNVKSIDFHYGHSVEQDEHIMMEWTMTVRHPRLRGGEPVTVDGCTCFEIRDGQVARHRDYFDGGQMLYENLPLIGRIINAIKKRMGQ
ncbi:nuclear transport factor 2 family protein [Natronospirillum operosum]|uniref:Nuclear transport factor 2 family protein n=1 Tax=Natronospirillum operosum TaxID=2759953 RepID=A0A4Z0WET1_9GAMM|nr:nuclear transport factor 2 family protein [Natronospirillum operosum]TGG95540.1 nuclear transport factor 2 family protein [Natronospirillum operosum]